MQIQSMPPPFTHIDPTLQEFQDTGIYYKREMGKHLIFLTNDTLVIEHIYILNYDKDEHTIHIRYSSDRGYSNPTIAKIVIPKGRETSFHIFELYEWLRERLFADDKKDEEQMTTVPPELIERDTLKKNIEAIKQKLNASCASE